VGCLSQAFRQKGSKKTRRSSASRWHAIGRGCEAVLKLNCPVGPAELRENYGFSGREIAQMENMLADHLNELCSEWEGIHEIE
jgi:hypothetical protein